MNSKKYELLEKDSIITEEHRLYRIRALYDFEVPIYTTSISKGDLGGYVENEYILDMHDCSWIDGNSNVFGSSQIKGNVMVANNAIVCHSNIISTTDSIRIGGDTIIRNSQIFDNSCIWGNASVCNSKIYGSDIHGGATVQDIVLYANDSAFYGIIRDKKQIINIDTNDFIIDINFDAHGMEIEYYVKKSKDNLKTFKSIFDFTNFITSFNFKYTPELISYINAYYNSVKPLIAKYVNSML